MVTPMKRHTDVRLLHPTMRSASRALENLLRTERLPIRRFEGWRSPLRQANLFAKGRADGVGKRKVTYHRSWVSRHQYGLAEDWVFHVNGKWTWAEPEKGAWDTFHALVKTAGLEVLGFEKPHVQLPGLTTKQVRAGEDLPPGDVSWRLNLETAVVDWGTEQKIIHGLVMPGAPAWVFPEDDDVDDDLPEIEIPPGMIYDDELGLCRAKPGADDPEEEGGLDPEEDSESSPSARKPPTGKSRRGPRRK